LPRERNLRTKAGKNGAARLGLLEIRWRVGLEMTATEGAGEQWHAAGDVRGERTGARVGHIGPTGAVLGRRRTSQSQDE
jgi:hypothetical protein